MRKIHASGKTGRARAPARALDAARRCALFAADWRSRKYWSKPPALSGENGGTDPWPGKSVEAARTDDGGLSLAELRSAQARLAHLRWLVADLKFDLVMRRLARKYSPDQPRVPAGSAEGGQWTDAGGGGGIRNGQQRVAEGRLNDAELTSDNATDQSEQTRVAGAVIRVCIAGSSSVTTVGGITTYWVEYLCTGGRTFRRDGFGNKFDRIVPDPFR